MEPNEKRERICCTTFDIDCCRFMDLFRKRPDFGKLAASAPIHAIRELSASLRRGFGFTDPLAFSPEVFRGMTKREAEELAAKLAGSRQSPVLETDDLEDTGEPDPLTAALSYLLKRPGDSLVATYSEHGRIEKAIPRLQLPGPLRPTDVHERLRAAEEKAAQAQALAEALSKQMEELHTKVGQLHPAAQPPSSQPAPPPPPPAGAAPQ